MANTKAAEATTTPVTLGAPQGISLDTLPKREAPKREINTELANQYLAAITDNGGATDAVSYKTIEEARRVGNAARRLVDHVAPDGQRARMRSFPLDKGGFGWAVFLGDNKPRKLRADAGKARNGNGS